MSENKGAAFSLIPLLNGFLASELFLENEEGTPVNMKAWALGIPETALKQALIEARRKLARHLRVFKNEELRAVAAWSAETVNEQLVAWGYRDIQLQPWNAASKQAFGFASLMRIAEPWMANTEGSYPIVDGKYMGYRVEVDNRLHYVRYDGETPIILTRTYGMRTSRILMPWGGGQIEGLDVIAAANEALERFCKGTNSTKHRGTITPQFKIENKPDVSDALGLQYYGWTLTQALMAMKAIEAHDGLSYEGVGAGSFGRSMRTGYTDKSDLRIEGPVITSYVRVDELGFSEGDVLEEGQEPEDVVIGGAYAPESTFVTEDISFRG